ncbi:glycoside hydrolase family 28 protein [Dendrothele bispora CBS 962.96]|uniref:Glycoside hydrolase family 28 protein n=1 Tax=Dendrothele bispora (strain CBS 962.96) TaxID=1314807 RepID=A0A4S8L0H5_DENBC|nr:glycoside hydrolase family 28 protein [Dendrothele bispora CBS 962.96]
MLRSLVFSALFTFALQVASPVSSFALRKRATCTVTSARNAGVDDVPAIAAAIQSCGNGGIIVLSAGTTYALRSTLDFKGCVNCEMQIEGILKLSDDTDFWNGVGSAMLLSDINGARIHSVTGSGLIDGNGVPFWQRFNSDSTFRRPTLVSISGGSGITIENLLIRNAPNVFHSVNGGATNVNYRNLVMQAIPTSDVTPKNTDGFDVGASSFVTISDTRVENQDDCVAFKPGCNFLTVSNITCKGSHGLSVGSLAKSSNDMVQNVIVSGATMIDSTKATGIKLYDGSAGHGIATVKNVTFDNIEVQNCDYAAQIQSCYESTGTCVPSKHIVDGVKWTNIRGTTSSSFDPVVANMDCPADGTCNISFSEFTVTSPSGGASVLCSGVDSNLGVSCSGAASG